ncbi:hypothetical protein C772_00072 [Bhargavaea cecembensis DSE10]|uniref:DUF1850 domain-containing protein n=1 Tax=Bhargavaea cecembensis DSE10 TaxID=1235279 RepID=M7PB92_9BACL|nr:DUF1850 domain-containing protein [Bhargavaea cecembensis]EMR07744.1 hypothetical protein C772_00072 [Bhargavaea cecembensis DSE10]
MKSKSFIFGGIAVVMLLLSLSIRVSAIRVTTDGWQEDIPADRFEVGWIHSVEKEPWFETYEVRDGKLYLTETRFKTFGAGVPSDGEIIPSDDGFVHMALEQEIGELTISTSANVRTTLYTEKGDRPLYDPGGERWTVRITHHQVPLWRLIGGAHHERN